MINKFYRKISNKGDTSDYELVGSIGVNGIPLNIMKGADTNTDGEIGLVPKPTKGIRIDFFVVMEPGWFHQILHIP